MILKESLSNSIKHARASRVSILLSVSDQGLGLTIADNGAGLDQKTIAGSRRGLEHIRSRVHRSGGTLRIDSRDNHHQRHEEAGAAREEPPVQAAQARSGVESTRLICPHCARLNHRWRAEPVGSAQRGGPVRPMQGQRK